MAIIYISIAVVVAALVFLGVHAVKLMKSSRQTMESLNRTTQLMQAEMNDVTNQTALLNEKTEYLKYDIYNKKQSIKSVGDSAKELKNTTAELLRKFKK
ncbi:DUF948 domain-containing protein [Fictibacillus sp. KIGAM418]|uniref:DUF948 domain-containing protein n=1 Tax=Fictibacillus marinisediminis TaxID=2878389 RepID=A0A9X1X9Q5_9BACL|nr:DUF948 domain-containing protein [Fictibacillus marinisediminis]MCK6256626.1 DUF948 domain-containing protein [Fictibacillus marinisediminis]